MKANRKASEIIHQRVLPEHKRMLAALTNLTNSRTETAFLTGLLEATARKQMVVGCLGEISLPEALEFCEKAETTVQKLLRTFFVAPAALGRKERYIAQTIMENPLYFAGSDPIFTEDEQYSPTIRTRVSPVDISKIESHLQVLADYFVFMSNNEKMRMTYVEYRKRTGESD